MSIMDLINFIRIRRISNREAERLVSIPDKFGESRKEEWERVHGPSVPTIPRSKRAQMVRLSLFAHCSRVAEVLKILEHLVDRRLRWVEVVDEEVFISLPSIALSSGPAMRGMRGRGPLLRGGGMGPDEEMMHVGPGRGRGRGFPRGGRLSFDNFYNHRNGPPMGSFALQTQVCRKWTNVGIGSVCNRMLDCFCTDTN